MIKFDTLLHTIENERFNWKCGEMNLLERSIDERNENSMWKGSIERRLRSHLVVLRHFLLPSDVVLIQWEFSSNRIENIRLNFFVMLDFVQLRSIIVYSKFTGNAFFLFFSKKTLLLSFPVLPDLYLRFCSRSFRYQHHFLHPRVLFLFSFQMKSKSDLLENFSSIRMPFVKCVCSIGIGNR